MSLQQAWTAHIGGTLSTRDTFGGLANVDRTFTMAEKRNWTDEQSAIMRTALNGTFFTRDKQIHSGKIDTKKCQWCDQDLLALPVTCRTFESTSQIHHDLHFFVDGGCHQATTPALRLGTWAVACADLENDSFLPIAHGQTPDRNEG